MGLCGAGHIARTIHQFATDEKIDLKLHGLGSWHSDDEALIGHLLQTSTCSVNKISFTINPKLADNLPNIPLINLGLSTGTVRVVRLFHDQNSGIEQICRIDWESLSPRSADISKDLTARFPSTDQVQYVVVHDMEKGSVSSSLIRELWKRYKAAQWFLRYKSGLDWLKLIDASAAFVFVGPEVLRTRNPWGSWLEKGSVKAEAVAVLENTPGKTAVLCCSDKEMIVRVDDKCLTVSSGDEPNLLDLVGWPSALFSALIFNSIKNKSPLTPDLISQSWRMARKVGVSGQGASSGRSTTIYNFPVNAFNWKEETARWESSREDLGIVTGADGKPRLEVWRGSRALPGYITCIEGKEDIVNMIGKRLLAFRQGEHANRPLSILLRADPGSGKTFLAQRLAEAFSFAFVKGDITQMIYRGELLDLFDTIATKQAEESRPVLVFVDEVNARLENTHVYGAFLAPIEEGAYARKGSSFKLKPCVWLFAETVPEADNDDSPEKYPDFLSRISMIVGLDYKSLSKGKDASVSDRARLEQVYIGAIMIKRFNPEVVEVDSAVLKAFRDISPERGSARKIREMVAKIRNVQYGRVLIENCQWEELPKKAKGQRELIRLDF